MGTLEVRGRLGEGFQVTVEARGHRVVQDLPPQLGGSDEGIMPTELLLASLAGCIGVVARIHAKKMGVNLRGMEIIVRGGYDTRGILEDNVKPGFKSIEVELKIDSDAPLETLEELVRRVEAHCPVSDTLASPTPVRIKMARP